jgi:hypothetical protein
MISMPPHPVVARETLCKIRSSRSDNAAVSDPKSSHSFAEPFPQRESRRSLVRLIAWAAISVEDLVDGQTRLGYLREVRDSNRNDLIVEVILRSVKA